jgi:mRNA interferase MazF
MTGSRMPDRLPRRGELWSADLNPHRGSEAGKVRPVLVVQSDLLNETEHASTWILPCTTRLSGANILRVELPARIAGNTRVCEVMIDQSRAIDRRRLLRPLGLLPQTVMREVSEKLRRVGDL